MFPPLLSEGSLESWIPALCFPNPPPPSIPPEFRPLSTASPPVQPDNRSPRRARFSEWATQPTKDSQALVLVGMGLYLDPDQAISRSMMGSPLCGRERVRVVRQLRGGLNRSAMTWPSVPCSLAGPSLLLPSQFRWLLAEPSRIRVLGKVGVVGSCWPCRTGQWSLFIIS